MSAGHQSRVFKASGPAGSQPIVVKVLDASLVDRRDVEARVGVVGRLARVDRRVCGLLPLDGRFVTEVDIDGERVGLVTCYEYAAGSTMVAAKRSDARLMGQALALLHVSMRDIEPVDLPLVAALRVAPVELAGGVQLLHGDFNDGNVRHIDGRIRIFDFDDCGYGPPVFDVANALYMVLFASMTGGTMSSYRSFEQAFVSGYGAASGHVLHGDDVNAFIDLRVKALESWLDDLETAPIGIRAATPTWHATLRSFVGTYHDRRV